MNPPLPPSSSPSSPSPLPTLNVEVAAHDPHMQSAHCAGPTLCPSYTRVAPIWTSAYQPHFGLPAVVPASCTSGSTF
jgi:hypothetical protein